MISESEIDHLVASCLDNPKCLKTVVTLLYDLEMSNRLMAAKVLGEIARVRPDLIRKRWQRIFYAFDDTMSCWGAAEALGEIGRNLPDLRGKIILLLKKFEKDDASCQGYIWAITRIAQVDRSKCEQFIPEIIRFINAKDICLKAQAIWSAKELGLPEAVPFVEKNVDDAREVMIYSNNSVVKTTIRSLARETLEVLQVKEGA